MCLVIFAHQMHPNIPLVVAANRDEFHARPTAAAHFWPQYPSLLAGQDLQGGGTWMGLTRNRRFAAITNFRDPGTTAAAPRSRGELPVNFLAGAESPGEYLRRIAEKADRYAGFNLLIGDAHSLWYFTNSLRADQHQPRPLQPGIYGLSNARLDTPWPKVERGKRMLAAALDTTVGHEALAAVVSERSQAPSEALQQQGLTGEMDPLLSSQFITNKSYGTRTTTTLWVNDSSLANWKEQNFDPQGAPSSQVLERFVVR